MFRRAPNAAAEEILETIAAWVVTLAKNGRPAEQSIADTILFDAAVVCYRAQTEHMDADTAAKWIRNRADRMVQAWTEAAA